MTSGPDIILGVARAADTIKQRQAAARLEKLSGEANGLVTASAAPAESDSAWSAEVRRLATSAPQSATSATTSNAKTDGSDQKSQVYVQFEAVLLQNMVEAMMPKDTEAMTGSGTAGQIWKSMLAEKIAEEIARSGTLGIAKQIAAGEAAITAAHSTASKADKT